MKTLKTMADFHHLISACRQKTLKKGERYTALELVLKMILKCGVTAQEIPYIWIQDVTDKMGGVRKSFPSYLYIDKIDIKPIQQDLVKYLQNLQQWNRQSKRNDPRLFPSLPRYQAIQRSIERLDSTFKISDIHEIGEQHGYPRRSTRTMTKQKVATYDSCYKRLVEITKIKNTKKRKDRAILLLRKIRHIRKAEDLEAWDKLEEYVQKLV
jgi:hypothetical protein